MAPSSTHPLPLGFDFMLQPTATYLTIEQVEIVFTLLSAEVNPASIPAYLVCKYPAFHMTENEVKTIRDGNFHVSGCDVYFRMVTTGNIFRSREVNDYFRVLPTISSLHDMRSYMQQSHEVFLHDYDLLDLCDGSFRIIGPHTCDLSTREQHFVPRAVSSEALWMTSRGCSGDFVSQYVSRRFGCYFPPLEIARLGCYFPPLEIARLGCYFPPLEIARLGCYFPPLKPTEPARKTEEDLAKDAALEVIKTATSIRTVPSSCLKRGKRRQPPLPIFTAGITPKMGLEAARVLGGTYTANPFVQCHNEDGTYTLVPSPKLTATPFVRQHNEEGSYDLVTDIGSIGSDTTGSNRVFPSSSTEGSATYTNFQTEENETPLWHASTRSGTSSRVSAGEATGTSSLAAVTDTRFVNSGADGFVDIANIPPRPLELIFEFGTDLSDILASPLDDESYPTRPSRRPLFSSPQAPRPPPQSRKRRSSIPASIWFDMYPPS